MYAYPNNQAVLNNWQAFIRSGFDYIAFSDTLHHYLVLYCDFNPYLCRSDFWHYYFASDFDRLQRFLGQFGGTHQAVDTGSTAWLAAYPANQALCDCLAEALPFIQRTLTELALQLYQAQKWHLLSQKAEAFNADPQRLIAWSHAYDEHVPFAEQLLCFPVEAEVRAFIKVALAELWPTAQQVSFFDTDKPSVLDDAAQDCPSISLFSVFGRLTTPVEVEPAPLLSFDEAHAARSERLARLAENRPLISYDPHLAHCKEVFDDSQSQTHQLAS